MTKKFTFSVIALAMAVSPFLSVNADNGTWDTAVTAASWNYDGYRVERIAFANDATGPYNLGNFALVAEPVDSCKPNDCDVYDVYMLQNGSRLLMSNVPANVLDSHRFAINDGRLVFVAQADLEGDHYAVTEYDENGDSSQLVEDVFFSGVESIDVLASDGDVYFNTALDFTGNTSVEQAAVYVYDAAEGDADIIGKHYELRDEQMLDAADGIVLEKMTFPSGNKQLWLGDTHNYNNLGMTREAISGTWLEPEADIYAAHFVDDSNVEFFMNFIRHTYNLDTKTLTKHDGQYLNWNRDPELGYQIAGSRMAWVDSSDTLYVSDGTTVKSFGITPTGQFYLESDRLFYGEAAGKMYDFASGTTTDIAFAVTDSDGGDAVVGYDSAGKVKYLNLATGTSYTLGFGSAPTLSDETHVYWTGVDGNIYEATVSLPSAASLGKVSAMKSSSSNTVYLVADGKKYAMPSEKTYFTWFSSWSNVSTVSATTLASYVDGGMATLAPGTKVKIANDVRVYVVGDDGKLHWITTQTVAYSLYGSDWNKNILAITQQDLVTNALGTSIASEADLQSI